MGFLTDVERQSLRMIGMILHVVGEDEFIPEGVGTLEHSNFFVSRILGTDVAGVYAFKEVSASRAILESMAIGQISFETGAQRLSREFSRLHGTTTRDGAFFIFELCTDDPLTRLYSLIKYDYREAIEKTEDEAGQPQLRRIINAFIDDKKAIQKSAIVRVIDGHADTSIAASDRSKASPEITDYFATFLDVERNRSDEDLNQTVIEVLRQTLVESRDLLPNHDVARALHEAKASLRDRQEISNETVIEAVLAAAGHPDNPSTRTTLRQRTTRKLHSKKLTGLTFAPNRRLLRKPQLRKLRTTEGVTVTYPDETNSITVRRLPNPNGQGEVITITTDRVVEDTVVRDITRRND